MAYFEIVGEIAGIEVLVGGIAGYALAEEDLLEKYRLLNAAPHHHRAPSNYRE